ncbi:MAG: pseudouridine synthase [Verrucomicrobiota bacterium]|nr:pseudouridine synthase [Verrucomicrobiota bacterium]
MSESQASIRLQKFLSERGICSRRAAEMMIADGLISVNGKAATLGQKIDPETDKVVVEGRSVKAGAPASVTIAMHKPRGVLCSNSDPHHDKTIFHYVPSPWNKERLYCAGRLDKDSEGLLILTNDGELTQKLTHPSHHIIKRYYVTLTRPFDLSHIPMMLRGFDDQEAGEHLKAEKVFVAKGGPLADRQIEVHLDHGRKREIRRLVEHFGYFVDKLIRYQIGSLQLKGLGVGRCKLLTNKEIALLFK